MLGKDRSLGPSTTAVKRLAAAACPGGFGPHYQEMNCTMCPMAPNERARVEGLLKEVTDAMRALKAANGTTPDEREGLLYREAMKLRRQLAEDAASPILSGSESSRGRDDRQDVVAPNGAANIGTVEDAPGQEAQGTSSGLLSPARQFTDATLHPVLRLIVVGVCALAWAI